MSIPISEPLTWAEVLDARDQYYLLDCSPKGPEVRLHLGVDRGHDGIESIYLIEMKAEQEAIVLRHPAAKGLAERLMGRLHPPITRLAGFAGLVSPSISASIIAPPLLSHRMGVPPSDLMFASSSVFAPADMTRLFADQIYKCAAVARLLGLGPARTRPDQTVHQQFGRPHRIVDIGLRPGTFFTCAAFPKPTRTPHRPRYPRWLPVDASRLHRRMRAHVAASHSDNAEEPPWSSGRSELRSSPCPRIQGAGRPPPSLCQHRDHDSIDATGPSSSSSVASSAWGPVN